jgi:hypothetical protein
MKNELEHPSPRTSRFFFKLTIIGFVLLGSAYGFLLLMNTAMTAIK